MVIFFPSFRFLYSNCFSFYQLTFLLFASFSTLPLKHTSFFSFSFLLRFPSSPPPHSCIICIVITVFCSPFLPAFIPPPSSLNPLSTFPRLCYLRHLRHLLLPFTTYSSFFIFFFHNSVSILHPIIFFHSYFPPQYFHSVHFFYAPLNLT